MSSFNLRKPDFRRRAIQSCHYFLTQKLGVHLDDIYVTVFRGDKAAPLDEETIRVWRELGVSDKNIRMGGREENWSDPVNTTGPCGPKTEIYVDDLLVWSIVFNEYIKNAEGLFIVSNQTS